jgi:hypothetical protein
MAFFFNRTDAPHHETWIDLPGRVRAYTQYILDTTMETPMVEVGDMILVHLHPDFKDMLTVFEKDGFSCGLNHRFKVTRLYPWNHPADADARSAWVMHTLQQEQACAIQYFAPKLQRTDTPAHYI